MLQVEGGGLDLLELPIDRALNVVYSLLMRNRDEKERAKVETALTLPMPGERPRQDDAVWGEDAQGAAFMQAFGQFQSEAPATQGGGA